MNLTQNKLIHNKKIFNLLFSSLLFYFRFCLFTCYNNDNYETYNLDGEEGNYLIDINDYNDLKLTVTTSRNIYSGISPIKKSVNNAKLNNCSSIATVNDNYILATCLNDSLLSKININTGESTSLLSYDISSNLLLTVPNKTIYSLSIFEFSLYWLYKNEFNIYK